MRYTGPAFLHLTESEVREIVRYMPTVTGGSIGSTMTRMRHWLAYREATDQLHGDNRELGWNPQTRSHDA